MKITTKNEQETMDLAGKLAREFQGGSIIGLVGELGAGKTAFVRGLAKNLGVKENIDSPTYVFMKIYETGHNRVKYLCHVDAYRLDEGSDIDNIGLDEYLGREDVLAAVEWADRIKNKLPGETRYINLKHAEQGRVIEY